MIFLQLFYEFFKMGLFAVGGGLATLPFLEDISQRRNCNWICRQDMIWKKKYSVKNMKPYYIPVWNR